MIATQPNFQAVGNCAFISLPSATMGGYTLESGIIVPPPSKRQEEAAACVGTVVAVKGPVYYERLDEKRSKVFIDVHPGEKIAVDYRVTSTGRQEEHGFSHTNAWMIDDQLVWQAKPGSLIAIERDGKWEALGDNVLLKKIVRDNPAFVDSILIIPDNAKEIEIRGRGVLVSGEVGVPEGTEIVFDPGKAGVYQFSDGEEFIVISKSFVLGFVDHA